MAPMSSCDLLMLDQAAVDQIDDLMLDTVRYFVEAHGGVPAVVGGIQLLQVSERRYCICIHVEGFAPPLPGAPADA
jgi:hypothetical protein